MAAFIPLFGITQSSSGLVGTVNDLANYGENTDNITVGDFSLRQAVITDAYGEPFTTVTFVGDSLTATFDIGLINLWANGAFSWIGINPVGDYSKSLEFPLGRVTKNLYRTLLKQGCCSAPLVENALSYADRFFRGSEIEAPAGNGVGWTVDINAAYSYLNQYPS